MMAMATRGRHLTTNIHRRSDETKNQCDAQIVNLELTVFILVHEFKYSVTDVFSVCCDARVVLFLDLVDDLSRRRKRRQEHKNTSFAVHVLERTFLASWHIMNVEDI